MKDRIELSHMAVVLQVDRPLFRNAERAEHMMMRGALHMQQAEIGQAGRVIAAAVRGRAADDLLEPLHRQPVEPFLHRLGILHAEARLAGRQQLWSERLAGAAGADDDILAERAVRQQRGIQQTGVLSSRVPA